MQFDLSDFFVIVLSVVGIVVCGLLVLCCFVKLGKQDAAAISDKATGGMTEASFGNQGKKIISSKAEVFSIASMKIENLIYINKAFGSYEYEQALKHIFAGIKSQLGSEELIARTGEDTFCFFLKNRKSDEICARLDRICLAVNNVNKNHKDGYSLQTVFGIYLPESNGEDILTMQNKAVFARVTGQRGNRYNFFDANKLKKSNIEKELAFSIDNALQTSEFVVFYQPKVRILDQKVVGAEALIRWRHPQRGILSTDMFLPLAEQYQKIGQIDKFVLEEVCRTILRWKTQERELCPISVNVAQSDFDSLAFADECHDICSKYGVDPALIEIEIREDIIVEDLEKAKAVFDRFHAFGFRCAIDNFGATYTSLQILGVLDVDTIKLDGSFFDGSNNSRRGRYIAEAILKLATQLHIRTVAAGIDKQGQVNYLQEMACDVIQGFYYFKPMPLEKFETEVYTRNTLKYVEKADGIEEQITSRVRHAVQESKSIVLFSYLPKEDSVEFSDAFSPVFGNKKKFDNALALFRTTDLIHENDRDDFFRLLERCQRESGWVENTLRFYLTGGRYGWLELRLRQESHGASRVVCGTMINISEWKNEVNRWKEKASRDALTGLYNREHFEQSVHNQLDQKILSHAAVVFIDVDDFKRVNDTMGHMFGDDVLCYVAKQILGVFRHSDVIARYGGDEFVVFAPSIQSSILEDRLKRLCNAFSFPYRNGTVEYKVSVTIGAAMYPENGSDYDTLVDNADNALYEAKRRGKNQFVLFESTVLDDKTAEK